MSNIVSFTVTVTDHTKPGQDLYDLMVSGAGGTLAGYTVKGGAQALSGFGACGYRSIQVDSGSPGSVYVGDANTANDGTQQGLIIAPGDVWDRDNYGSPMSLQGVYVRASADSTVFNVMVEGS
jgi:hypothetical protein